MYIKLVSLACLVSFSVAVPTWDALWEHGSLVSRGPAKDPSRRPNWKPFPKHCGKSFPTSPSREKLCYVQAKGDGSDDADNILAALKQCNNGGHVVFPQGSRYVIGTALDLTFLKHIDIGTRFQL
jgi:galacturan 1,4-alpha-galacturonidase